MITNHVVHPLDRLFSDSHYKPKDPHFFAELPLSREVPTKFRDLRDALEQRTPVSLRLAADGDQLPRVVRVTPLWFNRNADLLVVAHPDGTEEAVAVSRIEAHVSEQAG